MNSDFKGNKEFWAFGGEEIKRQEMGYTKMRQVFL